MADVIRWGIVGAGNIANKFAQAVADAPGADLAAIASRSREKADDFADRHGIPIRHASYEDLAADDNIDALYVSTPHSNHLENTLMGLRAGKGVLCEKPFALNEEQARQMVDCARETNCFLMEAMWTRFLPTMATLRTMIADGVIGEPRMVQASFGFRSEFDPKHRLFNPALGGGALLDVGVYCVSFAHMVLGEPREIKAVAALGETGVDEQSSLAMVHEQDALSACTCAIRTMTGRESMVLGTEAYILVEAPWFMGNSLRLVRPKGDPKEEQIDAPMKGNGFNYQIEAASRAMLEGRLETDVMPWEETLAVMRTMDAARAQWGLRYPGE